MMLVQRDPVIVYRRIEFDARVNASDPRELVSVCYEQLIGSLGGALIAVQRGDNMLKSQSLTRALAALTALQMGVDGDSGMAVALMHMYTTARRAVLDSALDFNVDTITLIRQDFIDIAESLSQAAH